VRSDVPWCTQCYAALKPKEPEEPLARQAPAQVADGREGDEPARQGAHRTTDPAQVERMAEQMLAELAATRDEVRGMASRLPSSRGARAALVAVVIVGVTAVIVLLMFVLGSFL
jgi:hypothetical protein